MTEYQESTEYGPVAKIQAFDTIIDGKVTRAKEHRFGVSEQSDFKDEEFYLPNYGISESILVGIKPNPWFKRGLFVAVNLVVLLGIVLVVFSRRTKSV